MALSKFHTDALSFILNQYEDLSVFLAQIPLLTIENIEHTGVGCFYTYNLPGDYKLDDIQIEEPEIIVGNECHLTAPELEYGASVLLWIRNKRMETLEILAHGDAYPESELDVYKFEIVPVNRIDDTQDYRFALK